MKNEGTAQEGKRNAKTALNALCSNPDRARECLSQTPMARLRLHGTASGLTEFLEELEERTTPAVMSRR